jgi:hypothetical protein
MFVELAVIKFCRSSGAGFIDIVDMNDIKSVSIGIVNSSSLLTVDCSLSTVNRQPSTSFRCNRKRYERLLVKPAPTNIVVNLPEVILHRNPVS